MTVQGVRGEPVLEKLKYLEKTQWLSNKELEDIQILELKKILIYSLKNVPYYQKSFKPYSDLICKLRFIEEIEALPLISKRQIQANFNNLQSSNYKGKVATESTSGSLGDPFKFKMDRNAAAFNRALICREHKWFGLDIGAKEARFYGMPMDFIPNMKERIKDFLMNRKRFDVFDLSEDRLAHYYKLINEYQPEYLYGYTSAVSEFIRFMKLRNLMFKKTFLKAVIVTSEVLYEDDRQLMESWLEVPVVNEYGTSELGVIASQCPSGRMHISSENVVVEILKDNKQVQAEERGEVVLTGLSNYAMPLIRYKVGDVASISRDLCPCGRGLTLLEKIEGRVNNMVLTPEGKIVSGLVFYYISRSLIENNAGIQKFKVIQTALDSVTFQIVKGPDFKDKYLLLLEKKTHEYLSPRMRVNFEFKDNIPPTSSGKMLHFVSKLEKPFRDN